MIDDSEILLGWFPFCSELSYCQWKQDRKQGDILLKQDQIYTFIYTYPLSLPHQLNHLSISLKTRMSIRNFKCRLLDSVFYTCGRRFPTMDEEVEPYHNLSILPTVCRPLPFCLTSGRNKPNKVDVLFCDRMQKVLDGPAGSESAEVWTRNWFLLQNRVGRFLYRFIYVNFFMSVVSAMTEGWSEKVF